MMKSQGANIICDLESQPRGMTEFDVIVNTGHRFRFGQPTNE